MAGNIQGNITEELEYLPSNLREYAIDKLAAGKLTEAEILGLNELPRPKGQGISAKARRR